MIEIIKLSRKPPRIPCYGCGKSSTIKIDGTTYCSSCGDSILIRTIGRCIKGVEKAIVKISILPKGVVLREQRRLERSKHG